MININSEKINIQQLYDGTKCYFSAITSAESHYKAFLTIIKRINERCSCFSGLK